MPASLTQRSLTWRTPRKVVLRLCLLGFAACTAGCDGQMQASSSSPFAPATPQRQPAPAMPAAGLPPPDLRASLPQAPDKTGLPESAATETRSAALPMLAPIPLRGKLEEDLVYEGLLDPHETQLLVRALEAANRDAAMGEAAR